MVRIPTLTFHFLSLLSAVLMNSFRILLPSMLTMLQVRSAQTLTLLSESLKLSLLLSKTPDPSLNDEALQLIQSTDAEKLKCAALLAEIMGLDVGSAEELVQEIDRN